MEILSRTPNEYALILSRVHSIMLVIVVKRGGGVQTFDVLLVGETVKWTIFIHIRLFSNRIRTPKFIERFKASIFFETDLSKSFDFL
jgi:hypothetical protein